MCSIDQLFYMKKFLLSAYIVTIVLLLSACGGKSKTSSTSINSDTLVFRYAENIHVIKHKDFTEVRLRNPWDTLKILHTYLLVSKDQPQPAQLPTGTLVKVPLEKSLVYSSVHCSLWNELGSLSAIAGVCDRTYIRMEEIQKRYQEGRIVDCGGSMNPDIEKVIDLSPDAILLSPFENSGGYGRIEKLNIPIIECADYMETSPLGRAEWMKFFGMLTGKEAEADSLFQQIEKEYVNLKKEVAKTEYRPSVITELKFGSAWYVPGGRSTVSILLADAGAHYLFADNTNSGSVPLSFETVFDKGHDADFWLIKYNQATDKSYEDIAKDYAPYKNFSAWKEQHIFGCNTHYVNFYEESPFHPERLLKDLTKIFHPELLPEYELSYYANLNKNR